VNLSARNLREAEILNKIKQLLLARGATADWLELDWAAEEWTRGGPTCMFAAGGLTRFGPVLREPAGSIHWAGTETSPIWNGYMDGAVRSGERAAAEVISRL